MTQDTLPNRIEARRQHALASGALQPIDTALAWAEEAGIRFPVRWISSLARKEAARRFADAARRQPNPFQPWEAELEVGPLGERHVALLNKFPVMPRHLLIITRAFEPQDAPLASADFAVLAGVIDEAGGLGFYNAGEAAGASQPHRHLQWIPREDETLLPLLGHFDQLANAASASSPLLRCRHALIPLARTGAQPRETTPRLSEAYRAAGEQLGLALDGARAAPYNLLISRDWLLMVPRRRESHQGIPVNALGFAGSLFVRAPDQLDQLRRSSPLGLLAAVAEPEG